MLKFTMVFPFITFLRIPRSANMYFIEAGFWRYLVGVTTLTLFSLRSWPSKVVIRSHLKGIGIVGLFGLFGFNLLLFWGLKYTSSLNATLIISLNPIFTLILSSLILKTTATLLQMLGAFLGISGVFILLSDGDLAGATRLSLSKGDLLIPLATVFSAFYHIGVKKYRVGISNRHFTLLTNLICLLAFITIFPFNLVAEKLNYSAEFWITTVVFGCFGTAVTYIQWNYGLGIAGPGKASLYMSLVPLFTAALGIVLGAEVNKVHVIS